MASDKMLSVIVPVYKVDKAYLCECFESIISQSFSDIELIIIDDGADEDTASFIDSYDHGDTDVKIIHQENKGVAAARNVGLSTATGKYVTFIDSDDTIEQDCFKTIISYAEENSLDVLLFGINILRDGRASRFSPYLCDIPRFSCKKKEELLFKILVGILPFYECPPASADAAGSACAKLYRRDFLVNNDLNYTPGLKRAEDMEYNLRVIDKAGSVGYLYRMFYNYRQIATSATYTYRPGGIEVFTASLDAIRKYLTSAAKGDLYMQVYYMRCMFFFLESMDMDYLNPANTKPFGVRIKELKAAASADPYAEAFSGLRTEHLTFARKIPLFLIKHGMFITLACFYTVYNRALAIAGKK